MKRRLIGTAAAVLVVAMTALTGAVSAAATGKIHDAAYIRFQGDRVALQGGRYVGDILGTTLPPADQMPAEGTSPNDRFMLTRDDQGEARVHIAFEIVMLGERTGYWALSYTAYHPRDLPPDLHYVWWRPQCSIARWGWQTKELEPVKDTPFTCDPEMGTDTITYRVALNRTAEAKGELSTKGSVSLVDGVYDFNNLPYRKAGTSSVAENSMTDFSVVWRYGDDPQEKRLARARVYYRIVDKGKPTDYWVVAWSQTEVSDQLWSHFEHEATCFVSKVKPGSNGVALDHLPRDLVLPYTCTKTYEDSINGDRGSYLGKWEVSKRS